MVKEMDKVLEGEQSTWSFQETSVKGSHRSAKEIDAYGQANAIHANDMRARKRSHPAVGSQSQDKHKESNDYIRVIDASMQLNEGPKPRDSHKKEKVPRDGGLRNDGYAVKSAAKLEEKVDDLDEGKKPRRSVKGDTNRQNSRDKHPDQEGGAEVTNLKDMKAFMNAKIKEDIIEASKFSFGAALKAGVEDYMKKSIDRTENKSKNKNNDSFSKKNKTHVMDNSKDKIENLKVPGRKNSAPKPSRPATGEKVRHHEQVQYSPERSSQESHKLKDTPVKKSSHDRSQSVEPKKKLIRQHKSKGSINEDEEETSKKLAAFQGNYKGTKGSQWK